MVTSATQIGAVFPNNVALDAVVYNTEEFQNAKSKAVNSPPKIGKTKFCLVTLLFFLLSHKKIGKSIIDVISRRKKAVIVAGASAHRTNIAVMLSASIPVASAIYGRIFDLEEEVSGAIIMLIAPNCNSYIAD
jgi:predicted PurR-regulated permease PerM